MSKGNIVLFYFLLFMKCHFSSPLNFSHGFIEITVQSHRYFSTKRKNIGEKWIQICVSEFSFFFFPVLISHHLMTPQINLVTLWRGLTTNLGTAGVKVAPPRAATTVKYCLYIPASVLTINNIIYNIQYITYCILYIYTVCHRGLFLQKKCIYF